MAAIFKNFCIAFALGVFACSPQSPKSTELPKAQNIVVPTQILPPATTKDTTFVKQQVVLLSGGGKSPISNNYSQYLQTLRFDTFLSGLPTVQHTVFFASGKTPENNAALPPDVAYKAEVNGDMAIIDGVVPGNQAATKDNLKTHFSTFQGKTWKNGESLLLLVGDHGLPHPYDPFNFRFTDEKQTEKTFEQNCIDLWHPETTLYPETGYLSVSELKDFLVQNVPATVPFYFVMTQCYSGAFHGLAYSLDDKGYPHRDAAERCGFTAITKDTTASGCTSFVDKDSYDGYERRMTEEITGVSVIEAAALKTPSPSLSEAHDAAFLSDHTKDVPLRTSEAYLLDWLDAHASNDKTWDEKDLEKLWVEISETQAFGLGTGADPILQKDFERRLGLIKKTFAQMQAWYPIQYHNFKEFSLKEVSSYLASTQKLKDEMDKQVESYNDSFSEKLKPLVKKYLLDLKTKTDAESLTRIKFEKMFKMPDDIFYSRFRAEDSTLKSYQYFINYSRNRNDIVMDWAADKPENQDVLSEIEGLAAKSELTATESLRQEVLYGELRRLKLQMKIAAATLWLVRQNQSGALADFRAFLNCEAQARVETGF